MSTGYTKLIENGTVTSFRGFAFRVLMGTCDETEMPTADEIIDQQSVDYHRESLARAEAELERIRQMTLVQWRLLAKNAKAEDAKEIACRKAKNKRLGDMLRKVLAWQTPTEQHEDWKRFMIDQLKTSMISARDYCPPMMSYCEYRQRATEKVEWEVNYHRKELAKTEQSNAEAVEFFQKFMASLPVE
ncbi:hypothetical protein FWF89_02680 [Candidatus Saccharibacteria bacterium]|nr:hypothetical protein [Candidatus Saccharibacteria bacterium]